MATFASIAKNLSGKGIASRMQDPQVLTAEYKGYTLRFAANGDGQPVFGMSCSNKSNQSFYNKSVKAVLAHCDR